MARIIVQCEKCKQDVVVSEDAKQEIVGSGMCPRCFDALGRKWGMEKLLKRLGFVPSPFGQGYTVPSELDLMDIEEE